MSGLRTRPRMGLICLSRPIELACFGCCFFVDALQRFHDRCRALTGRR